MKLDFEFIGAERAEKFFLAWLNDVEREMPKLFRQLSFKWHAEAVKRVPVDQGTLKEKMLHTSYTDGDNVLVTDVGTNIESESGFRYPQALEFGTRYIAGGAVEQIGDKADVSDLEAVHSWPAKDGEATDGTSVSIDRDGGARGRLRDSRGRFAKGAQEQMPWLRTSWTSGVKGWFLARYNAILRPRGR